MGSPSLLRLDLRGKSVVLVGDGPRAATRAEELVAAGARVRLVAEHPCEDLRDRVVAGELAWVATEPRADVLDGVWLVSLRTPDRGSCDRLQRWCADRAIWCEGAEGATAGTVASARVGDLTVAVCRTGAADSAAQSTSTERVIAERLVGAVLAGHVELRAAGPAGAPLQSSEPGRVVLVGGGPGDPDLLTVRGRAELAAADVVVADRLGPGELLPALAPAALVVDVGKQPYHHPIPQEEINRLLVEHALLGRRVVRLKGGDPFVLGRGGEEVLACAAAGVPVEVVPGVSSAFAAPAAAGIPVTHRGVSTGVLVVSGHAGLDVEALARSPHTVVVLMGMARLRELVTGLVRAGRDPATPVAVVQEASTPRQRAVRGTLTTIADAVAARRLTNPAVIVVGEVADVLPDG